MIFYGRFFIALLPGPLMSVQGVFNTQVTKTMRKYVSNAWGAVLRVGPKLIGVAIFRWK